MTYELELQRLDITKGDNSYVVFGPRGDYSSSENPHRPRPKVTLSKEDWEAEGKPTILFVEVEARETVTA